MAAPHFENINVIWEMPEDWCEWDHVEEMLNHLGRYLSGLNLAEQFVFVVTSHGDQVAMEHPGKVVVIQTSDEGHEIPDYVDKVFMVFKNYQPFVAPREQDIPLLATEPEKVRGTHYDVVINGVELGSGSLRNHRSDVQRRIFEVMGYSKQETEKQFGFLLNALDAGAPPHGGFAYGLDRWVMVLAGVDNLRDVIAFPKTQRGQDLLMDAPTTVEPDQLDELRIRLAPVPKKDR